MTRAVTNILDILRDPSFTKEEKSSLFNRWKYTQLPRSYRESHPLEESFTH